MTTKKIYHNYSHAILIFAAEQYIIFNDENPDARRLFINLVENATTLAIELPEEIGLLWQPFENWSFSAVMELIETNALSMNDFMEKTNTQNVIPFNYFKGRIYLRDDIEKIDDDILDNVKRYDLINSLSDADGAEFNLRFSDMEAWLINQWQLDNNYDEFYLKIAKRFNIDSYQDLMFSGDREQCFLICFLEEFKRIGRDANFSIYCDAVLNVDPDGIVDNERDLMLIN